MQLTLPGFTSLLPLATTVMALPSHHEADSPLDSRTVCILKPKVPKYPVSLLGACLTDKQAEFIVGQFKLILTNPDRAASKKTAEDIIAEGYSEESDAINILAGYPSLLSTKEIFINGVAAAPAIPSMETLEIFHGGCNKISWRWNVEGLGLNKHPVKGINTFHVDPWAGQIKLTFIEFSSIAWGEDIGWTCTPPAGPGLQ